MDKKTILITEHNGTYQIQNNGISEFALVGILECIVFDLKSANRGTAGTGHLESPAERDGIDNRQPAKPSESSEPLKETEEKTEPKTVENQIETAPIELKREVSQPATAPDLRIRISNAIKAIRGLGAQIEDTDLSNLTKEELQSELEELTSQYKRLKNSKGTGK